MNRVADRLPTLPEPLGASPASASGAPAQAAASSQADPLQALLGTGSAPPAWRRPRTLAVAIGLLVLLAAAALWLNQRGGASPVRYVTEPVVRGNLAVTVSANGTLQPTNKVDVGSELSGTVARVLVDVNDPVRKGQVLAELDSAKLSDQVLRSRAGMALAQAKVAQAAAAIEESRGNLERLTELSRVSGGRMPSMAELAAAQASLAKARADQAAAEAGVADARAGLSVDETNLRKASIRSPINGVVLSRSVDPGNAVAASLQAVTLFTLAEDLAQMKLVVNVDEADVGQVRAGQTAQFTVSAYPNRQYPATIVRVGLGSTTKDNVVTYVTELRVDNSGLSLRPGMTATAVIAATERRDVLLVPNAALRYSPSVAAAASAPGSLVSRLVPRMPGQGLRRPNGSAAPVRQLWVLRGGAPAAMTVQVGVSDGRTTEVEGSELQPGLPVIVDQGIRAP